MLNRNIALVVFGIVVLAQLYVPANMIAGREDVLATGEEFWFEVEPIDPADPFRGRYVVLSFKERRAKGIYDTTWQRGDDIYVTLDTDANGFANVRSVSKEKPIESFPFVKARIGWTFPYDSSITIDYPFERFYMEETKAPVAEKLYNEATRDTVSRTYAVVRIKDGEAVLEDVMINGVPIREAVRQMTNDE